MVDLHGTGCYIIHKTTDNVLASIALKSQVSFKNRELNLQVYEKNIVVENNDNFCNRELDLFFVLVFACYSSVR